MIENIDPPDTRGGTYRIRSNISLRIDLTPDYYNIKYFTSDIGETSESIELKDLDCSTNYSKIKSPDNKVKFLGEEIREIERNISLLENERRDFMHKKECLIVELKNIMDQQYRNKLIKTITERRHKEKNIKGTNKVNPILLKNKLIFIGKDNITAFLIDNGQELWKIKRKDKDYFVLPFQIINNDLFYPIYNQNFIYKINLDNGKIMNSIKINHPITSPFTHENGIIYYRSEYNYYAEKVKL